MKVKNVCYAGEADVYNMEVDGTHSFVIEGGVVSHNCADETRYMCMAQPIKPVTVKERKPEVFDPLSTDSDTKPDRYAYYRKY